MAGGFQEAHKVLASDRRGHGIDERVVVQRFVAQHGLVEHNFDAARRIIDRGERRHGPRLDSQRLAQEVGRAERKTAAGAEPAMQRLQLDRGVLEGDDELERPALVLEEEIFRVAAGNLLLQVMRFRDGEYRRMADGAVLDLQAVEKGEQIVRGCGHGGRRIWVRDRAPLDPCQPRASTPL